MNESTTPQALWYRKFCCGPQLRMTWFALVMFSVIMIVLPGLIRNSVKQAKPTTGSSLVGLGYTLAVLAVFSRSAGQG
jgi:hypothetical protein